MLSKCITDNIAQKTCTILSLVDIWLMTFFLCLIALSIEKDIQPLSLHSKIFVLITQNLISHFTMVLRVAEQWEQFFTAADIPSAESKMYAATFVTNRISMSHRVTITGDILAIIQNAKSFSQPSSEVTSTTITSSFPTMPPESLNKWPLIRPPEIMLDMTNQQFLKIQNWRGCV